MGFVYIMTNPCLPKILKIGKTKNIANRQKQLSKTSTPFPFVINFFIESEHYDEIERLTKLSLGEHRVNKRREFFDSSVEKSIAVITSIAKNLELGIKYLPITHLSDEEFDFLCSDWNTDYEYSMR